MTSALVVLGFLELPEEDVPPELIWHHDSRMETWWEEVRERRANPRSNEPMEDVPTTDNDLADEYR